MRGWRQAFDRIGGPDAVTWPAFWITYASSLTGNFSVGGAEATPLGVRLAIITVAQLALFAPLLLLRWTALRHPPRPRPWVAVAGFVVAAVVRGIVAATLFGLLVGPSHSLWLYRIIGSLQNQALVLLAVALTVSSLRAHTRSLEELLAVQRELVETQAKTRADVSAMNEEAVARVQARLRAELACLESAHGEDAVAALQRLANEIVRPMSHELASSVPPEEPRGTAPESVKVTWQQAVNQMVDRPPLRPFVAAAFLGFVLTSVALGVFGPARGIPLALVMFVAVWVLSRAGNWALGRVLPRRGPAAAPYAVVVVSLAIGLLSAAAAGLFLPVSQSYWVFVVGGGLFTAGAVLVVAVVTTVRRQQELTAREVAASTGRLQRQLVRLRQAQWVQQQGLSRALHGPVQAAVTSAAIRLDAAFQAGTADQAMLEETRKSLRATVDVLDSPDDSDRSLDLAIVRITGVWQSICHVTSEVAPDAAALLAEDPIAAAVASDVITDAVSNAVRHGDAQNVRIAVRCEEPDLLTLLVRDDGRSTNGAPMRGLGTALLDECALAWTRTDTTDGCSLRILLPAAARAGGLADIRST